MRAAAVATQHPVLPPSATWFRGACVQRYARHARDGGGGTPAPQPGSAAATAAAAAAAAAAAEGTTTEWRLTDVVRLPPGAGEPCGVALGGGALRTLFITTAATAAAATAAAAASATALPQRQLGVVRSGGPVSGAAPPPAPGRRGGVFVARVEVV